MNRGDLRDVASGSIARHKADGSYECGKDELAVEEPLEIRIRNKPIAVTMRTPGYDAELAAGFLLSEGMVRHRCDIRDLETSTPATAFENVINVVLASGLELNMTAAQRFGAISASCGLCGKASIKFVRQEFPPLPEMLVGCLSARALLAMPDKLRAAQDNFTRTGGIHAAGIFNLDGELLILREDIGRHNAVDKAIGRAFLDHDLPLSEHVLLVSGRTSFEILQKALAAGLAIVASVSAPSTLAVNFARETRQTLVGFLRPPTFNVYSHVERIAPD
jgi:FdhD protein